jgi:hypothetical protein
MVDRAGRRHGGAHRRATVCGGCRHGAGPPWLSPSRRQAGSIGENHLHQVGHTVRADIRMLETERPARDAGWRPRTRKRCRELGRRRKMPPAALGAKKKNPPTQVVTSGLDCFLTST